MTVKMFANFNCQLSKPVNKFNVGPVYTSIHHVMLLYYSCICSVLSTADTMTHVSCYAELSVLFRTTRYVLATYIVQTPHSKKRVRPLT